MGANHEQPLINDWSSGINIIENSRQLHKNLCPIAFCFLLFLVILVYSCTRLYIPIPKLFIKDQICWNWNFFSETIFFETDAETLQNLQHCRNREVSKLKCHTLRTRQKTWGLASYPPNRCALNSDLQHTLTHTYTHTHQTHTLSAIRRLREALHRATVTEMNRLASL